MDNIIEGIIKGDHRYLAKAISLVENDDPQAEDILSKLSKYNRSNSKSVVIGITGPPGTGKSTLVDQIIKSFRTSQKSIGVIAIDPTSPFSGGAILGDRIRMKKHSLDEKVFIRSMAIRDGHGGISSSTNKVISLLQSSGKDIIIVETVGAGQSDTEIIKISDVVIVVLIPELGDEIQIMKAGLLEIADIYVVNKSDLDGSDQLASELELGISTNLSSRSHPSVVKTSSKNNEGLDSLMEILNSKIKNLKS